MKRTFSDYYSSDQFNPFIPQSPQKREYGFFPFSFPEQKLMTRHLSFKTISEVIQAIRKMVPRHMYYSAAVYNYPAAEMDKKGWLGADLIFDIDADHLPTTCKTNHDFTLCKHCGTVILGNSKTECSACGSKEMEEVDWTCDDCLSAARNEAVKLLDFLQIDLGVVSNAIRTQFTGNRGFHIIASVQEFSPLDQDARKEIVSYVSAQGMFVLESDFNYSLIEPGLVLRTTDKGWRGRMAIAVLELLRNIDTATTSQAIISRIGEKEYNNLLKDTKRLSESLEKEGRITMTELSIKRNSGRELLRLAAEEKKANIDTVVTTDTHRLIRLGGTLNGRTGLLVKSLSPDGIEDFDPFTEGVALPLEQVVKVNVNHAPKFRIGPGTYGPYHNETADVPVAVAVMLICHGAASLNQTHTVR